MQAMAAGLVPVGAPGMMPVVSVCLLIISSKTLQVSGIVQYSTVRILIGNTG